MNPIAGQIVSRVNPNTNWDKCPRWFVILVNALMLLAVIEAIYFGGWMIYDMVFGK